jgi:hypothetical protein
MSPAMTIVMPASVWTPGTRCPMLQSNATAQASAICAKGATADARPWLKASMMDNRLSKPLIARPSGKDQCAGTMSTRSAALSTLPNRAMPSVVQHASIALATARPMMRPCSSDNA